MPSPKMSPKSRLISFSIHVSSLDVIPTIILKWLLWYLLTCIVFNCRIVWPNQLWQRPVLKSLPELTAMKAGSPTVTGSRSNQFKTNTHKPVGQNLNSVNILWFLYISFYVWCFLPDKLSHKSDHMKNMFRWELFFSVLPVNSIKVLNKKWLLIFEVEFNLILTTKKTCINQHQSRWAVVEMAIICRLKLTCNRNYSIDDPYSGPRQFGQWQVVCVCGLFHCC